MATYTSNRHETLTSKQLMKYLTKLGDFDTMKRRIQKDLATTNLRLGMAYLIEYTSRTVKHPYPHIILHLADKSVMPFRLIHLHFNEAGTRLSMHETKDETV